MSKYVTTINNKRIFDYYNANKNVDIESMNIILLDFIEQLGNDMTKVLSNSIFGEILNNVKDIKQQVNSFNDNIALKLQEHNKSFIETTKLVIGSSSSENNEKITQLLNKNTDSFIEKINISIPKGQEDINNKIQENLLFFQKSINDDIKSYLSSNNSESSLKEFISTLDSKIMTMQQPIYTFLSSNQDQLNTKINGLREEALTNKNANEKVMSELNDFLTKYKSSSQFKGQCSENMLENVLNKMYPCAEIINTTGVKAAGDFTVKREGKQNLIIENKLYERNVNVDEIKKFLRDINEQKTNGIMMSQFSGIVAKSNFFIEIHDGKVLIYLHNVEYSPEKIRLAIDVIDNLSSKIEEISNVEEINGCIIKKDILDKINEQFQLFISQKEIVLTTVKEMNKKLMNQIEELKMPDLSLYLNEKYASIQNQQFACEVCDLPFQNKRSLAAHKKIHKSKAYEENEPENIIAIETIPLVQPLMVGDIEIPEITKSPVVLTEKPKKESKKKL